MTLFIYFVVEISVNIIMQLIGTRVTTIYLSNNMEFFFCNQVNFIYLFFFSLSLQIYNANSYIYIFL